MKICIKSLSFQPLLAGLLLAGQVSAQTFTTLHSFTGGATPYASLTLSGNALYGTAMPGIYTPYGSVFNLNTDGTGFNNLTGFSAGKTDPSGVFTNSDGAQPYAGLVLSGGTLYGTASVGGSSGNGTVFAVNTNRSGLRSLHNFTALDSYTGTTNSDGANPYAGLILSGNTLYGTASAGGSFGGGTVFAVNTDGTGFTNLHSFTTTSYGTNSDGASPAAGLILSGNTLYGTAAGGHLGGGTVFAVNTDGTGFTNLYNFTVWRTNSSGIYTNSDGAGLWAGLVLSGNTLYGTASGGGSFGGGTVFAVNTDGTGFTNLHSFTSIPLYPGPYTNTDGANLKAGLVLSGKTLYGTAADGGINGVGTVFALNIDGTGFNVLHSFTYPNYNTNSDGAHPIASLILSGNSLYGTASYAGPSGYGTVFSITLPPPPPRPPLTIIPSGPYVILTWPTNYTGFTLQSATNLSSPFWTTNLPSPVVVNGQNAVTNPVSSTQRFFRLIQ